MLADADPVRIRSKFDHFFLSKNEFTYPGFYGDGKTAEFILNEIVLMFKIN
jgi:hypothetical protein